MSKTIAKVWTFGSSSNPSVSYETLQYTDGSTSCNCKGWTRRVAADGSRSCKHTRYVDQGIADNEATSKADYTGKAVSSSGDQVSKAVAKNTKKAETLSVSTPTRKVQWQ